MEKIARTLVLPQIIFSNLVCLCVLTNGIQLEITRLRYSSKHNLNIYQFNYQAIIQLDQGLLTGGTCTPRGYKAPKQGVWVEASE